MSKTYSACYSNPSQEWKCKLGFKNWNQAYDHIAEAIHDQTYTKTVTDFKIDSVNSFWPVTIQKYIIMGKLVMANPFNWKIEVD